MGELLGVTPGSVTPFSAINDTVRRVTVVLDAAMMTHPVLNFHPLVNTATTTISREGLVRFLEATGHPPRIRAVSGAAPVGRAALEPRLHSLTLFPFNRRNADIPVGPFGGRQ